MRYVAVLGAFVLILVGLGACERQQKAIEQDLPAARAAKARADVEQIAAAVRLYQASVGELPGTLLALTRPQTGGGGPLLAAIPAPPPGWSQYMYARQADRFTVTSWGDGVTVSAPE